IQDTLNALGYRTTGNWGARPFGKDTVLPMLKSRFYLGEVYYKGEWLTGRHEPAIDEATWQRAQERIASRVRAFGDNPKRHDQVYMLRNLTACAECGNTLRGFHGKYGVRYYRDTARDKGHHCTQARMAKAESLESQIGALLSCVQLPDDWQARALAMVGEDEAVMKQQERERSNLQMQLERTKRLYQLGDMDERAYLGERERLQQQNALLKPIKRLDLERAAELLRNFAELWDKATASERDELVHVILQRVYTKNQQVVAVEPKAEYYPLVALAMDGQNQYGVLPAGSEQPVAPE
ncbi:MAG: recombinase family protein, partial [Chloroflexi bacterium]|nr:recombinase family protein [Chloroflexota bacterium]